MKSFARFLILLKNQTVYPCSLGMLKTLVDLAAEHIIPHIATVVSILTQVCMAVAISSTYTHVQDDETGDKHQGSCLNKLDPAARLQHHRLAALHFRPLALGGFHRLYCADNA